MKELKFRAWDGKKIIDDVIPASETSIIELYDRYEWGETEVKAVEQYTGLKDKNGKEIYENCELNGRYIVEYVAPSFVGRDITNGDIIELYDNRFTITKEHSEVSQNSEGSID